MVKESFDIRIDDVINGFGRNNVIQLLQCLMTASVRSEAVGEILKIYLVNGFQYSGNSALNNFIFNRRYSQWAHLTIGLGDIRSSHGLWLVRLIFHSTDKQFQVRLQIYSVCLYTHAINT